MQAHIHAYIRGEPVGALVGLRNQQECGVRSTQTRPHGARKHRTRRRPNTPTPPPPEHPQGQKLSRGPARPDQLSFRQRPGLLPFQTPHRCHRSPPHSRLRLQALRKRRRRSTASRREKTSSLQETLPVPTQRPCHLRFRNQRSPLRS